MSPKKFKVPATFTVPDTIEGVRGLMTATKWEKAAIVYAYTQPMTKAEAGRKGGASNPKTGVASFPCSIAEFADLGITGLNSETTVAFYRDQWTDAMRKRKAKATKIGEAFEVPTIPFPSSEKRTGTGLDNRRMTPANVAEAIKSDPKYRDAVAEVIKTDTEVAEVAWTAIEEAEEARRKEADLAAIQRGGKVNPCPPKSKLGSAWDAAKEAATRGEALQALEDAIDLVEEAVKLVQANGSPVDNEPPQIVEMRDRLIEATMALNGLVSNIEEAVQ